MRLLAEVSGDGQLALCQPSESEVYAFTRDSMLMIMKIAEDVFGWTGIQIVYRATSYNADGLDVFYGTPAGVPLPSGLHILWSAPLLEGMVKLYVWGKAAASSTAGRYRHKGKFAGNSMYIHINADAQTLNLYVDDESVRDGLDVLPMLWVDGK
jgi:hypothetical protein